MPCPSQFVNHSPYYPVTNNQGPYNSNPHNQGHYGHNQGHYGHNQGHYGHNPGYNGLNQGPYGQSQVQRQAAPPPIPESRMAHGNIIVKWGLGWTIDRYISVLINEKLDLDYGTFEPVVPPVCHPIPYANNYGSTHIQAHPGLIMQINWWIRDQWNRAKEAKEQRKTYTVPTLPPPAETIKFLAPTTDNQIVKVIISA